MTAQPGSMASDGEFRDALPQGPVPGRGAGLNPGNRFEGIRLHVLGEHLDAQREERLADGRDEKARVGTELYADDTRTIINRVDSPDLHFHWTVNPYRGCEHGCIYCYARPGHEYLGLSSGLDFETKIFAKHDAPELLRKALLKKSWKRETILFSGVTDPYQPVERELRITRRCLEVCDELDQPVAVISKNHMMTRDTDILARMAARGLAHATLSITSLDNVLASRMEPRASSPRARLDAVRQLSAAGIPVHVMTAPIVPGLNDREIPALLKAVSEAGARSASYIIMRLPYQIKDLFIEWVEREYPDRAGKILSLIRDVRGGKLSASEPFVRFKGEGEFARTLSRTYKIFARRYGLLKERTDLMARAEQEEAARGLVYEGKNGEGAAGTPTATREKGQLGLFE